MRRWAAVASVLLLAACANGTPVQQPATLKVAYKQGDTIRYKFHVTSSGTASAGGQTLPLQTDLAATETMKVTSVAPDGTATVQATLSGVTGTANGQAVPAADQTFTIQVTPDGRIVPASGSPLSQAASGQQFSIFPDHPVKPGDAWSTDVQRANPFGSGTFDVHADSRYLRDEKVNGVNAAVVETKTTGPLNVTVDLGQLGAVLGGMGASVPSQAAGITLTEAGTVSGDTTTWLDRTRKQVEKVNSGQDVDVNMTGSVPTGQAGPSAAILAQGVHLTVHVTVAMDRLA